MEDRPCVFDVDGIQVRVIVDLSQLTSLVSLEHGLDSHGCFFFLVYLKTVTIGFYFGLWWSCRTKCTLPLLLALWMVCLIINVSKNLSLLFFFFLSFKRFTHTHWKLENSTKSIFSSLNFFICFLYYQLKVRINI
jgi:hypothetical protein